MSIDEQINKKSGRRSRCAMSNSSLASCSGSSALKAQPHTATSATYAPELELAMNAMERNSTETAVYYEETCNVSSIQALQR